MAGVTFSGVSKVFSDGTQAVSDMDLVVADGEFVVLVGPSGCGKSTALRMLAGLESITSGTVSIGDRVVNDMAPRDRDIAMVFQNYALYPHMKVYDNIAFGLRLRKVPKDEIDERVRHAAQVLGLEDLLDRKPRALSGGQRQRVAMGRAIVREPQAFLMDEPLSNPPSGACRGRTLRPACAAARRPRPRDPAPRSRCRRGPSCGRSTLYDKFETAQLWGRNLADHLGDVYGRRSRLVVLFISKHYPAKAWPTHERQSAQARAILENEVVLLPARFDDTEVARNERIIGRSGVARRVDVTVWQSVGT